MKQCCKDYPMEQFGDEDVVAEIYSEYVKSVREKIPELEAAMAAESWSTVDPLAHAVKGNALATGDTDMANEAVALRIAAKMSDKATAEIRFAKMKELAKEI